MITLQSLWALSTIVALGAANKCCLQTCLLDDVECTTRGAHKFFALVVGGKGGSPPMDVLSMSGVRNYASSPVYNINKAELQGMSKCVVTRLQLDVYSQRYEHIVHCPELISTFQYTSRDDPLQIVKKGKVIAPHYDVRNIGQYGVNVNSKDYLPHFFIQSVYTQTRSKQKLSCFSNGIELQPRNADLEYVHYLIVQRSMKIVLDGINVYFEGHQMGEAFPRYNED